MDADNAHKVKFLIEHRHSSRAPFDPAWPVSPQELALVVDAARWSPTAHNMQNFHLVVVDDPRVLGELGGIRSRVTQRFLIENYAQLAWSEEELAHKKVGILGTRMPREFRTPDPTHVPENLTRTLADMIDGAPMVIIVAFDPTYHAPDSEHDALGMISLGCVLENMWLAAQASKLDVQIVSAFASVDAAPEVKRVLGIPETWRIAYALRLGHAKALQHDPHVRRDPDAFVHHNRF
jgi:nitroreductase